MNQKLHSSVKGLFRSSITFLSDLQRFAKYTVVIISLKNNQPLGLCV